MVAAAAQGGLWPQPNTAAPAAVMLSEAKHLAPLRQSARFFVAALLRMTGSATAATRSMRARRAARRAHRARGTPRAGHARAATPKSPPSSGRTGRSSRSCPCDLRVRLPPGFPRLRDTRTAITAMHLHGGTSLRADSFRGQTRWAGAHPGGLSSADGPAAGWLVTGPGLGSTGPSRPGPRAERSDIPSSGARSSCRRNDPPRQASGSRRGRRE